MAVSTLLSKGRFSSNENAAIFENEMHDGKLSDDEQMRMMLAEERISTMMALSQMGGYGRYPLQSYGQMWPGLPNSFSTFCPYPPHLLAPPYDQMSNEPLDLRLPKIKRRSGCGEVVEPAKKRCVNEDSAIPPKIRRNDVYVKCAADVTRGVTARRITKRRNSSIRRSRESPAAAFSVLAQKSALELCNNNQPEQNEDNNCTNCEENRKLGSSPNRRGVTSRDQTITPEGLKLDEEVASRLFQPITDLKHSPRQGKENAGKENTTEKSSDTPSSDTPSSDNQKLNPPVLGSPVSCIPVTEIPDSDPRVFVTPAPDTPPSKKLKPVTEAAVLPAETPDEDGIDELRNQNLDFKQKLDNLRSEVEKLRNMMKRKTLSKSSH
jgi:hypothetical protein